MLEKKSMTYKTIHWIRSIRVFNHSKYGSLKSEYYEAICKNIDSSDLYLDIETVHIDGSLLTEILVSTAKSVDGEIIFNDIIDVSKRNFSASSAKRFVTNVLRNSKQISLIEV